MDDNLADPDLPPEIHTNTKPDPLMKQPPVGFFGLPPVMEAKHDGEGGGRQHLLVVVVVQTVSSCQGKSVANLGRGGLCLTIQQIMKYAMYNANWLLMNSPTQRYTCCSHSRLLCLHPEEAQLTKGKNQSENDL